MAHSASHTNLPALRGFVVDGKTDAAKAMFENGVKIYPLSGAEDRPQMEFSSFSGKVFNTIHANDREFYDEMAQCDQARTDRDDRPGDAGPARFDRHPQGPSVRA